VKQGEFLRDYLIITKPSNDSAGKCMWCFAEKAGEEFFVKEFLEPKRPRPESMGSAQSKLLRLAQCEEFERRHWSVIERIDPTDLDAGNLVTAVDFFCEGTKYYKVTRRLYPADLAAPYELTPHQKGVLLGTLADSLRLLHRLGIVHGDLKPQNVLLHRPAGSDLYTAKLIDFDDAYISGEPPETEIGGDALYGAPELVRYLKNDPETGSESLTTAADMFAFGLLVHVFLTGTLPGHHEQYSSPAEAVNAGAALRTDPRLHRRAATVVAALTTRDPATRPSIGAVLGLLTDPAVLRLEPPEPTRDTRPNGSTGGSPRLRINVGSDPAETRRAQVAPPPAVPTENRESRLRINLGRR
jgi:serine/threonine protein kinase